MADLAVGRGVIRSFVTPYTEELQIATYLIDAWMMKMLPLELVGEFIKSTNKKLWRKHVGGEEDVPPAPTSAPVQPQVQAPAPKPTVPATPLFGQSTLFGSALSIAPKTQVQPAQAPPEEEDEEEENDEMNEDDNTEEIDWDTIEFTTADLLEIRESMLTSLKKETNRRLFFDLLPKAPQYPYLCVKKGAATHVDVMLEMLRRNNAISF